MTQLYLQTHKQRKSFTNVSSHKIYSAFFLKVIYSQLWNLTVLWPNKKRKENKVTNAFYTGLDQVSRCDFISI